MKQQDEYISTVDKYRSLAKYLWRVIIFLSIALVALAFSFMTIKDTVKVQVELPAKFIYKTSPVVVAGVNGANEVYYSLWGKYIVEVLSDFTYENFPKKIVLLKKMMRSSQLVKKEKDINKFKNSIILNLMSQDYQIMSSKIVNIKKEDELIKQATLYINGMAKQTIGQEEIKKECQYSVDLKYVEGVLYVEDFGTNCF